MWYTLSDHTLTGMIAASAATFIFNKRSKKDWLRLWADVLQNTVSHVCLLRLQPHWRHLPEQAAAGGVLSLFPEELRRQGRQRNSMYSGHAAQAASAAFFAAKVYCDYHPELAIKNTWCTASRRFLRCLPAGYG
jgi:hypothetical protein